MKTPQHIAIIMDGNRRWARERGLPVFAGHEKVANQILEPLIERASQLGIKYITLWAFSTENWQREKREVSAIMRIFRLLFKKRMSRLHEKGVRVKAIGDLSHFDADIRDSLLKAIKETENNKTITAVFALSYGGRDEIIRAVNKVIKEKKQVITKEEFTNYLDTAGIPDPDLIVRTGGDRRLSGFLLWQSEYSELLFTDWYMPDFTPEKLDEILADFVERNRRFGR